MPVSGSDKLELPVLGCRFSEKAEHLPIKKRRFLFRTPSPPHNKAPSDTTENLPTCLNSSNQESQPQQPLAESLKVGSIENKVNEEKLMKPDDDMCNISLGSYGIIKSLEPPVTVKLEANSVNQPNISDKETGLHISTVNNSISDNQVTSQGQKSGVCDERLNWDLNTVMAWEESPEFDHNIHEKIKEGSIKVCKQEQVCGNAPETISDIISTNLRSLTQSIHGQDPEERKPNSNHINKLLFPVISTTSTPSSSHVTVSNIKPTDPVPRIVKSEYPPCNISTNHSKSANSLPAGIGLSLDYTILPRIDHTRPSEENAVTSTIQTTENENLNLSLVTVASLPKQVDQTIEEDDKAKVKRVITSSCITMENPNQSTIGSLAVIQSPQVENQPSSVQIKSEKSTLTPPSVSYNKEVSNVPSDIQGSEVDNEEEFSVGYDDSQFEDGEVRESSIQTWEGDNRENETEHGTDECAPESSSRIRSIEKGTDEISISSVLLPEKPDTSEQISNSEQNETDTKEVDMKDDEIESNQWKMNVSGSDNNDYTKIKDFTKVYKREQRDTFINRGSRFRMQGFSSTNGDNNDSGSRSREIRPFKRGKTKFSPHVRGGATWNRDRFFRDEEENDDVIRPGPPYPTRAQSFRTRLVGNREEDNFRARLGLRPAGDTRFVANRGRYGGPANGGYDEPLEYLRQRRCFSPTEQRRESSNSNNNNRLRSGSTSPLRSQTRSRSPRIIRRPRSPDYRFESDEYNSNNNSTRWVKYKERPTLFQRSPPPPLPVGERLSFFDSRKTKPNENYRRFSDVHEGVAMDNGYRRGGGGGGGSSGGGFVKRHEIGRVVKHMEYDEEEDGYGLEFHGRGRGSGRGNPRFSRRGNNPREERERENW